MPTKLLLKVEEGREELAILAMFQHLMGREATSHEIEEVRVELAGARALREASSPPERES